MSVKTVFICDECKDEFKTDHSGGKTHDFQPAIYWHPVPHMRFTDTRGDTYDFCSKAHLADWLGRE